MDRLQVLHNVLQKATFRSTQTFLRNYAVYAFEFGIIIKTAEVQTVLNAVMDSIYSMHAKCDN